MLPTIFTFSGSGLPSPELGHPAADRAVERSPRSGIIMRTSTELGHYMFVRFRERRNDGRDHMFSW